MNYFDKIEYSTDHVLDIGIIEIDSRGYIHRFLPDIESMGIGYHINGWVPEHYLLLSLMTYTDKIPYDCIDHMDGDVQNNRLNNLYIPVEIESKYKLDLDELREFYDYAHSSERCGLINIKNNSGIRLVEFVKTGVLQNKISRITAIERCFNCGFPIPSYSYLPDTCPLCENFNISPLITNSNTDIYDCISIDYMRGLSVAQLNLKYNNHPDIKRIVMTSYP